MRMFASMAKLHTIRAGDNYITYHAATILGSEDTLITNRNINKKIWKI